MKWPMIGLTAAVLLVSAVGAASAQTCWSYGGFGPKARGYYGTPYGSGPRDGNGGGDQYGYGAGLQLRSPAAERTILALALTAI